MADTPFPVLIVGAGPTGLAMASELSRFGVPYRIVDKAPEPAKWSQALVVQARTLEQFARYGLAEKAVQQGRPVRQGTFWSDGKQILRVQLDGIDSPYPFVLFLPQSKTERILSDHVQQAGGRVERKVELAEFVDRGDYVQAQLRREDGQIEHLSVQYLIGCDGAHSVVRHDTGVAFEGDTVPLAFRLADIHIDGNPITDELRVYTRGGDDVFIAPLEEDLHRVIVEVHDQRDSEEKQPPLTVADFQEPLDRIAGPGLRLHDPTWVSRYHINQRKAKSYRVGRCFLAGDASHVHSPLAGQGMNTGIQDTANLAWKLAAVLHGAPDQLLDSYNEERGKVGAALLAFTSGGLAIATTQNPILEAIRDLAARQFGGSEFVQEHARGFISETAINYRWSSIVRDHGHVSGSVRAGDRAPAVQVTAADGRTRRLYDALCSPDHLLLASASSPGQLQFLKALWSRDFYVPADPAEAASRYGPDPQALIIRPDGYVGCRCAADDLNALRDYMSLAGIGTAQTSSARG